jgi:hypothetical protein
MIVTRNEMDFLLVHFLMNMDLIWFEWVECTYLGTYLPTFVIAVAKSTCILLAVECFKVVLCD